MQSSMERAGLHTTVSISKHAYCSNTKQNTELLASTTKISMLDCYTILSRLYECWTTSIDRRSKHKGKEI